MLRFCVAAPRYSRFLQKDGIPIDTPYQKIFLPTTSVRLP